MYRFGTRSMKNLSECHPDLQRIMHEVIKIVDCAVIDGHRDKETQDKLYHAGQSKLKYPDSKHNKDPSKAVDVVPYPIDWNDSERFYFLAGVIRGVASQMNIKIRQGVDWDGDGSFKDQTFHDLPHTELLP